MLKSLRTQLLLIFTALFVVILAQAYLTLSNKAVIDLQLSTLQNSSNSLSAVRELERNMLDIQRTVLSYRQTQSPAMVGRFNSLYTKSHASIDSLSASLASIDAIQQQNIFNRMRIHIEKYDESFVQFVKNTQLTETVENNQLINELEALQAHFKDKAVVLLLLTRAQDYLKSYQLSPDSEYSAQFMRELQALLLLPETTEKNAELSNLASQFFVYTQMVTSDLFLTNVVMAGSANEILYLSSLLVDLVASDIEKQKQIINQYSKRSALNSQLITGVAITIALLLIVLVVVRVLSPITRLTRVFKTLTKGHSVGDIPGRYRKDEIGSLAAAAQVFKDTNSKTQKLLEEAQTANEQQYKLNEELYEAKEKAELATALKSRFLANMSHEIRTPINGIVGLIELLLRQKIPPKTRDYVQKISHSSRTLLSVINDVLDFSKIEAGKLDIVEAPFSMHSLFDNILTVISIKAEEKNLSVRLYADPKIPQHLVGDAMRITQVLLNLCTNSVKFTHKGEIALRFDGETCDIKQRYRLRVSIVDTGIGMSQEQKDRVFQPFTQADNKTSRQFGGTGLGLAIVKQLVDLMKGEIEVHSYINEGSTFLVTFNLGLIKGTQFKLLDFVRAPEELIYFSDDPLTDKRYLEASRISQVKPLSELATGPATCSFMVVDMEEYQSFKDLRSFLDGLINDGQHVGLVFHQLNSRIKEKLSEQFPGQIIVHPFSPTEFNHFLRQLIGESDPAQANLNRTLEDIKVDAHVLLVEDNEINQMVAGDMLSTIGITYDIAANGQQAIQKITNADTYDLVLMDVQMPVMDGLEATKALREMGFSKPIVGLSANAMEHDKQIAEVTGMDDYLTKPVTRAGLISRVVKHLTFH